MTTKEEVLRLAAEVGLETYINGDIFVKDKRNSPIQEIVTKLIELAKAQGAADAIMRDQYCKTDVVDEDAVKARLAFIYADEINEAIRNRERKE